MENLKASELMLGNYYDHNGEYKQVTPNTIMEVWEAERSWCKPIPLTEDILFKCPKIKKNIGYYLVFGRYNGRHNDKTLELAINNDTNELQYYVYVRGLLDNEFVQLRHDLKYLHEFQNLVHIITNEELTIKL